MQRSGAVLLVLASTTASAVAQPGEPAAGVPAANAGYEVTSYRTPLIAASVAGLGLWAAGGLAEGEGGRDTETSDTLFSVGMSTVYLGAPIVHAIHGEWGRAVGSLGMRLGLSMLGGVAGMALSTCDPEKEWLCELDGLGYGMLAGATLASVIDVAAFAEQRAQVPMRPAWTPTVAVTPVGGQLGLGGTF